MKEHSLPLKRDPPEGQTTFQSAHFHQTGHQVSQDPPPRPQEMDRSLGGSLPTASFTLSLTYFLKSLSTDSALPSCFPSWVRHLALTWHFSIGNQLWHQGDSLNLHQWPWTTEPVQALRKGCWGISNAATSWKAIVTFPDEEMANNTKRTSQPRDCSRAQKFSYLVICIVWLSVTFMSECHFKVSLFH